MAKTTNFAQTIRARLAKDPDLAALVEQEKFNANVAIEIFNAREEAGLTQSELAERINSHQSSIARLESADYDGHTVTMLQKIAHALNRRLRVEFCAPCDLILKDQVSFKVDTPKWSNAVWDAAVNVKRVYSKAV